MTTANMLVNTKQDSRVVLAESDTLLALYRLGAQADAALDALLREVAQPAASKDAVIQNRVLDMVLTVRAAHEDRVVLSNDRTMVINPTREFRSLNEAAPKCRFASSGRFALPFRDYRRSQARRPIPDHLRRGSIYCAGA